MLRYHWREGYRGKRAVAPDLVASELGRLGEDEPVTASRIVAAAEPEEAPLHPELEWDDAIGGREYRLIQARQLARGVVVLHVPEQPARTSPPPVSLLVHVPDATRREGKYVPPESLVREHDDYQWALTEAQRALTAAQRRVEELYGLVRERGGPVEALAIAEKGLSLVGEAIRRLPAA